MDKNVITDVTEEAQLLASLAEADASGTPVPERIEGSQVVPAKVQSTETPETDEQGQSEESEESPEAGTESEETDATDEVVAEKDKATETTEPQKPQSKAEKDQARVSKAFQKIEAEKAEIAKARAELDRAKAEIAQSQAKKPEPVKDENGFTAEDYDSFVRDAERENAQLEKAGDSPKWGAASVEKARYKAQEMRLREQHVNAERTRIAVEAEAQQTVEKYPELKNPESPMAKAMKAVWESNQEYFSGRPGSMKVIAELAAGRVKTDSVPALEKKITELTNEVKRLTNNATPSKGAPVPTRSAPKAQSDAELEATMRELDRSGVTLANI